MYWAWHFAWRAWPSSCSRRGRAAIANSAGWHDRSRSCCDHFDGNPFDQCYCAPGRRALSDSASIFRTAGQAGSGTRRSAIRPAGAIGFNAGADAPVARARGLVKSGTHNRRAGRWPTFCKRYRRVAATTCCRCCAATPRAFDWIGALNRRESLLPLRDPDNQLSGPPRRCSDARPVACARGLVVCHGLIFG